MQSLSLIEPCLLFVALLFLSEFIIDWKPHQPEREDITEKCDFHFPKWMKELPDKVIFSYDNIVIWDGIQIGFRRGISTFEENLQVIFHCETDNSNWYDSVIREWKHWNGGIWSYFAQCKGLILLDGSSQWIEHELVCFV